MTTAVPRDPHPPVDLTPAGQIAKLRYGDPGERYYAAWWLGRMRIQAGIPALIEALADETDRTAQGGYPLRRNAARALGKLGSTEGIPALIKALRCSDGQVVAAAAQALAEIALQQNLQQNIAELGAVLIEGLHFVEQGLETEALAALEALIEALGQLQPPGSLEHIHPYLEHDSLRLQCAAARACYRLTQDPAFAQRLLPMLAHENVHLRRAALLDLGASGYLPGAPAIATAAVEANIKLLALKQLVEINLEQGGVLGAELRQVLLWIDELL
ncbi:HEAT repeat domain-containing protein [Thermostichus vulcanus]|uniref:HEAT repeat domain-containing protein n=1 Tax=Thermostichus vulcanus str. 'Rupite' TaxID=2813851 RepID=A0ABT0C9D2_THEVL|nr:HEAT repeat domain-containing protein [Thermostichus vulcanus]MCJ2542366.1 HEAT repeat domain-containing protein [Thermostichus vulcanus str. 'Rupite']